MTDPSAPSTPSAFPDADLPDITVEQMRQVDRIMVDELHITLLQMMENAGRNLAELAIRHFTPVTCTVLAGPGGNGGGGLAAARHLANRGVAIEVVLSATDAVTDATAHQLDVLGRMSVPVVDEPRVPALVLDAVIGYSLTGDPHGRSAELVGWANEVDAPTVSLDTPSGLDLASGRVGSPCVIADATLTLALPKRGLRQAPTVVGTLFVADIGVPPSVYDQLGIAVTAPFAAGTILRVR